MNGLRGIATGILIATIILGLTFIVGGYGDQKPNSENNKTNTENTALTDEDVQAYAKANKLVIITQEQYDQMMNPTKEKQDDKEVDETTPEEEEQEKKEKVIELNLEIKSGMSTQEVADKLQKAKIIKNSNELIDYLAKHKLEGAVKAGDHKVTSKMSIADIAKEITSY
jgi:hypothetical protein